MTKPIIYIFCLALTFCSCNNPKSKKTLDTTKTSKILDKIIFDGMHGTWVRQNKQGFTLLEIEDTAHILYYEVFDRKSDIDTITHDRFWYYKSKAKMGYWDKNAIWISTDKFRFDYKLKGDTLIEFDKMGDQGMFIKVFTDEQKAYQTFNSASLNGKITSVNKVNPSEFFVLDNVDNQFSFTSIPNAISDNKQFTDLAAVNDSIIKSQHSDTMTLIKRQTKKIYKFNFVRR